MECSAKIAVTSEVDIKKGTTLRRLELGDIVEVLEGPRVDPKTGVQRVKARALSDGVAGWISIKGNQGTPFLVSRSKPYLCCTVSVPLEGSFEGSAANGVVRTLQKDEVLEVIEGPRSHVPDNATVAKCKACKDGKVGWFVVKSRTGQVNADDGAKYYLCVSSIAMTDTKDIKNSKCLCKAAVGELFLLEEGPVPDQAGVARIRCTSVASGTTGWITVKGNQGTVYAEERTTHYAVRHATTIHAGPDCENSEVLRELAIGEPVEILEGPREEKSEEIMRIKGRVLGTGCSGWVTAKTLKPWAPSYKCVQTAALQDSRGSSAAKELRRMESGEVLEVLEGPCEDPDVSGSLRIRARLEHDGMIGWASLWSPQNQMLLAVKLP